MITCKKYGCEFQSIWRERYPGGAETGVTVLFHGAGLLLVGSVLYGLGFLLDDRRLCHFVGGLFLLMGLVKIWMIPDNRRQLIKNGGNRCPECDTPNEIHWYD